jgi:hypothetical protein
MSSGCGVHVTLVEDANQIYWENYLISTSEISDTLTLVMQERRETEREGWLH